MITVLSGDLGDFNKQEVFVQKLLIRLESAGWNEVEEAITNIIEHAHKSTDKVWGNMIINRVLSHLKDKNRNLWL